VSSHQRRHRPGSFTIPGRRGVAGLGAFAALLVGASVASAAPALSLSRPCLTAGEQVAVTGSGFTPNGPLQIVLRIDSDQVHESEILPLSLTADATGSLPANAFVTLHKLISPLDSRETITVTVNDLTRLGSGTPPGPDSSASAQLIASQNLLFVLPWELHHASPLKKTTFLAIGFEPFKTLYLFYKLHGKVVKRVRLGTLTGPCGDLVRTMPQFPFRPVAAGDYTILVGPTKSASRDLTLVAYKHVRVAKAKAVR
jgi:hypothetical protein